ncbi:HET-domain-containing protein [Annulohypoxylon stygium]|nr:HET-domain-containing protein [Annulohypoxylon stygium]
MWFINTKTLELNRVHHPDDIRYAILSHTWEEDEDEVDFQEMRSHLTTARMKKGFGKIAAICRMAQEKGIPYAWVDTCCIDKSSSEALSEAINSMFQLYKGSYICYAYLSDLSVRNVQDFYKEKASIKEELSRCRWFSRGWTLQELIAPDIVNFYDQDWNLVGSKEFYKQEISIITGIDSAVLVKRKPLSDVPVGRRMSWASKRETKRIEDIAYCLLGIFDVNMPMIYGEGRKAFTRLQEEILKTTEDLSLLAWTVQSEDAFGNRQPILPDQHWLGIRGVLARSPSEFSRCGTLENIPPTEVDIKEFSMTNKGLKIQVDPGTSKEGDFFLTLGLSCMMSPQDRNEIVIYLLDACHSSQYLRHRTFQIFTRPRSRSSEKHPPITVYIKRDISESQMDYLYFRKSIAGMKREFSLPPGQKIHEVTSYPLASKDMYRISDKTIEAAAYECFVSCFEFCLVPRGWRFLVACVRQSRNQVLGIIWSNKDPQNSMEMEEILKMIRKPDVESSYEIGEYIRKEISKSRKGESTTAEVQLISDSSTTMAYSLQLLGGVASISLVDT